MRRLELIALRDSINNLCDFLSTEYNINNGGCCFIASLLAEHLEKLQIDYELIIYSILNKDITDIQFEISNQVKNKTSNKSATGRFACNHYTININGIGEVNSGQFKYCYRYKIIHITSKNIKWIYRNSRWNEDYNTCNNKTIKNIVKSFFEQYESDC